MENVITARVFHFGDNIDTDIICPGRFLELNDPKAIASHAMAGLDPDFPQKVKEGDIIVAGRNFGCGSSREHAVMALKYSGLKAIVAQSFGRIFYRNAVNLGLIVIVSKDAYKIFRDGDTARIELDTGKITNLTTGQSVDCDIISEEERKVYEKGGMIELYKELCRELPD